MTPGAIVLCAIYVLLAWVTTHAVIGDLSRGIVRSRTLVMLCLSWVFVGLGLRVVLGLFGEFL